MECEQSESIASTNIVLKIKNVEIQGQCIRKQTLVFQEICFNTVNIALHFVCHLEPNKFRGILYWWRNNTTWMLMCQNYVSVNHINVERWVLTKPGRSQTKLCCVASFLGQLPHSLDQRLFPSEPFIWRNVRVNVRQLFVLLLELLRLMSLSDLRSQEIRIYLKKTLLVI